MIKYAYLLNRGGIAIHTESEEEVYNLRKDWPAEAFEGVHLFEPRHVISNNVAF